MPPLGADCPLDADLAGALLHHHIHDVGHPDSGDEQSHGPHHAKKNIQAEKNLLLLGDELGRIPDKERFLIRGIEAVLAAQNPKNLVLDPLALQRIGRLEDDAVEMDVTRAIDALKGGERNDRAAVVRSVVHRGLQLFRQDADDGEGQAVQLAAFADRILLSKKLISDHAAEEEDAPFLLQVHLIEESAARNRIHSAHEFETGINPLHIGQGGAAAMAQSHPVFAQLRADLADHGEASPQQLHIGLGKADAAADRQSLVLDAGLVGPDCDDAVGCVEQPLAHAKGEAGAKGHQQNHHHSAPGDGKSGQKSAQLLFLDVLDEFFDQHPDVHGENLVLDETL
ncbi:MAG: hypothetical protein BWY77_00554 [bacterium ADurb.Bin431]|nr:MAG: hypothetical protein BWY77_00554 [bacterium ADurb.Bin431]